MVYSSLKKRYKQHKGIHKSEESKTIDNVKSNYEYATTYKIVRGNKNDQSKGLVGKCNQSMTDLHKEQSGNDKT